MKVVLKVSKVVYYVTQAADVPAQPKGAKPGTPEPAGLPAPELLLAKPPGRTATPAAPAGEALPAVAKPVSVAAPATGGVSAEAATSAARTESAPIGRAGQSAAALARDLAKPALARPVEQGTKSGTGIEGATAPGLPKAAGPAVTVGRPAVRELPTTGHAGGGDASTAVPAPAPRRPAPKTAAPSTSPALGRAAREGLAVVARAAMPLPTEQRAAPAAGAASRRPTPTAIPWVLPTPTEDRMGAGLPVRSTAGDVGQSAAPAGEIVQRAALPGAAPSSGPLSAMPPRQIARLAAEPGGGAALAPETRRQLEPAVGRPLGDVRVHRGPGAGAAARALSAQAFTIGKDIFMGAGQPGPATRAGLALLAHEATHVAQQVPIGFAAKGGAPGAQEGTARAVARQVASGHSAGKALAVDALEYGVAGRVSAELEARVPGIFALAKLEARREIDMLVATDGHLRAVLAASRIDEPELAVPVQLAIDGKSDAMLARELGTAVARQVVEKARLLAGRSSAMSSPAAAVQRSPVDTPLPPYIAPAVEQMMRSDVETIVSLLRQQWLPAGDERRILEIIARWSALDDHYREETGYQGTDNLDKLLLFLKIRSYTRRTARSGFIEQHSLAYDDLWRELEDERLDQFRALVAKSKKQGTAGPTSPESENFWATMGTQEAMGLWGMLKGMGTGLAGMVDAGAWATTKAMQAAGLPVADPASAADWLAKQYDLSGEAMFGKEWSQGEDLFLGLKAADIGTTGGTAIWTLVMIGAGGSGPNAPAAPAWAKAALVALGITGSLKGVSDSANNIAKLIERMQKEGRFSWQELLSSGEFWMEATKMAASIFAAVSGASGLGGGGTNQAEVAKTIADALKARVGILLDVAQVAAQVGRIVEIGLSDLPPADKEKAAGQVVKEMIATGASIAGGIAQYRQEHGQRPGQEEAPEASAPKAPGDASEEPALPSAQSEVVPPGDEGVSPRQYGEFTPEEIEARGLAAGQEQAEHPTRTSGAREIAPEEIEARGKAAVNEDQPERPSGAREITPEEMDARAAAAGREPRGVGSPGTGPKGRGESRTGTSYQEYNAAETALGMRFDYNPDPPFLRSVEFDVPTTPGNEGTRPGRFNLDPYLEAINVSHPSHGEFTGTDVERGHGVAQEYSGGDPDVARDLMRTTNIWPMRGRGSKGVNQGTYRAIERHVTGVKQANPDASVRVRIEAVVGDSPKLMHLRGGRQVIVPEAFHVTITIQPHEAAPRVETRVVANKP